MNSPVSTLSYESFGIRAERLLLPIDLAKYPLEILPLANGFTKPFDGKIIMLHVSEPKKGFEGLDDCRQAERHLRRIGQHLSATVEASYRVRTGVAHEEILAEAAASQADLILLPVFAPSIWKRVVGSACGETARRVIAGSSTKVFVVNVRTQLNCLKRWQIEPPIGRRVA
jgi:nucleotide-binding universal stress UspA family protein